MGWVARPLGLHGEVLVSLTTNRTERLDEGSILTASKAQLDHDRSALEAGDRDRGVVPSVEPEIEMESEIELEVVRSRAHGTRWAVLFKGISDRDAASLLQGCVLMAAPMDAPGTLWVHDLVGREVHDLAGLALGRVVALEANPASDLLVLDSGAVIPLVFLSEPAETARGGCETPPSGNEGRAALVVDLPNGFFEACT